VSVHIAMPQSCWVGRPALTATNKQAGTIIPASPTRNGRVSRDLTRSSPMSNSRRASRPTTKKKKAISPELTNVCRSIVTPWPPSAAISRVSQNAS
jgi:hypothetical protein